MRNVNMAPLANPFLSLHGLRPDRVRILPVFFAQLAFQDFPCARLGQGLEKFNGMWTFVMAEARAAEFQQLLLCSLRARLQDNESFGDLAPAAVGHRNNSELEDGRMGVERFLDFQR